MQTKKQYKAPTLTEYGRIEEVTQAFSKTGTGDILSNGIFGVDTGCWTKKAPLCVEPSTGS